MWRAKQKPPLGHNIDIFGFWLIPTANFSLIRLIYNMSEVRVFSFVQKGKKMKEKNNIWRPMFWKNWHNVKILSAINSYTHAVKFEFAYHFNF